MSLNDGVPAIDLIKDGEIIFGEWLPDLPAFRNPGLVQAKNVLPIDDSYTSFPSLQTKGDALADAPIGGYSGIDNNGDPDTYAGTLTHLYQKSGSTWADRTPAPYTTSATSRWHFAQFDTYVIATNYEDVPQRKVIASASNFQALATTGTAPNARVVGVINRFVMLGDINDGTAYPYGVQWSAINDATNWPTPASISARTVQSGRQLLDASYGQVTAIADGQFYGLVFQKRAISRFTYVGGDVVFQVDTFERSRGCWAPESMIQIGNICRFYAHDGWYQTDGQSITPIGAGKIDETFLLALDQVNIRIVSATVDWNSRCIFWAYPTSSASAGTCDRILIYNFQRDRWAWAEQVSQLLIRSYTQATTLEDLDAIYATLEDVPISLDSVLFQGGVPASLGFTGSKIGTFSGTQLDALLESAEIDGNPFGRIYIGGVRPLVTGSPSSVLISLKVRDNQDDSSVYGTPSTRTSRTGVCDFRTQGKFISCRLEVQGGFERAIGIEYDAIEGDQV